MKCDRARNLIEQETVTDHADAAALREHLQECKDCRADAEDRQLVAGLRSLPVPSPGAGYEQRVMSAALDRFPRHRMPHHAAWFTAMAASVCLAVVLTLQLAVPERTPRASAVPSFTVTARPHETRVIDVVLDTKRPLSGATLMVSLGDGLELENRPRTRELRWTTDIKAGGNKLSLPVKLLDENGGDVIVILEHGELNKQVRVRVTGTDTPTQGAAQTTAIEVNHG